MGCLGAGKIDNYIQVIKEKAIEWELLIYLLDSDRQKDKMYWLRPLWPK
jgi:hypothetical protein